MPILLGDGITEVMSDTILSKLLIFLYRVFSVSCAMAGAEKRMSSAANDAAVLSLPVVIGVSPWESFWVVAVGRFLLKLAVHFPDHDLCGNPSIDPLVVGVVFRPLNCFFFPAFTGLDPGFTGFW